MKRLSLRWKLVFVFGSLALGTTLVLGAVLHFYAQRQLLEQVEKTLETKCDEVITVLENSKQHPTLEDFLIIETNYRYTPYRYFYQIRDAHRETLVRSENLGDLELPLPSTWNRGGRTRQVHVGTDQFAFPAIDEPVRIRSERLDVNVGGRELRTIIIQTAVSLGPLRSTVRATLLRATLVSASILGVAFVLVWFVTSAALHPVVAMTRKATRLTATNLRERLPVAGRGDELDELASVLNDMLDRLDRSLRQMEQFSSDAAHQLRTPLTRIRGELELILCGDVAGSLREELETIQVEVDRLSRLCGRLLLLGRLDSHSGESRDLDEIVDLQEVAEELVEQMSPLAHEHGIQVMLGEIRPARIRGNRMLLVEALLNLLDNAIRCTPKGGTVTVAVNSNAGEVILSVADTGPGVPSEAREQIFQPFFRIPRPSARVPVEGSGLGLAIVRSIAQAHGGRVELADSPHRGSVFRMAFPLHSAS